MLLRTRVVWIVAVATVLLVVLVAAPLWVVQQLSEQTLADARREAQQSAWAEALSEAAAPFEAIGQQLAAEPALVQAAAGGDADTARKLLAAARQRTRVVRLDLITAEGRLFASSAGLAVDRPLIETTNLRSRIEQDPWLQGIEAGPEGGLLLVMTAAFPGGRFVTLAASAEPVLQAGVRSTGRQLFAVDRAGKLLLSTTPAAWPAIAKATQNGRDGVVRVRRQGRVFSALSTPLVNAAGLPVATLVSVQDVTASVQRQDLLLLLTGGGAVLVFAALLLALYGFLRSALDPLTEVTRVIRGMAAGDALVSADIPARRDEVGAIAGAVEVFRRDIVALNRSQTRDVLRQAQQMALIRQEMGTLAGMLEAGEREEILGELQGALTSDEGGAALADGFRRMAGQVVAQHRKVATLLAERTRDLEVVRQALAERAQLSRLRQELEVARHLQLSSLPQIFPPFPDRTDFEVFAAMQPAKEVGGDFYDFALLGGDRLALMIGDASGKGVSAALFIAMARSILRSAIVRGAAPSHALALANSTLAVENHTMMFATVFVAVLDLRTGWLTHASAGHNPPYVLGPAVQPVGGGAGIALGIVEDAEYEDDEVQLAPGASLVLFTDGVTEAHAPDNALFGEARLEAALADLSAAGPELAVTAIQDAVSRFAEGVEQADDITVLAARWHGPVDLHVQGAAGRLSARPDIC